MIDKYAWAASAYYASKRIISRRFRNRMFLAEHVLAEVVKEIGDTYDLRTYGGVIRSLSAEGYIERGGYSAAKTSNGSVKPLWRKVGKR